MRLTTATSSQNGSRDSGASPPSGPAGIPVLNGVPDPVFPNTTLYQVTVGEFTDQLHPALGPTRLWGYWDTTNPVKRHLGGVIITPAEPGSAHTLHEHFARSAYHSGRYDLARREPGAEPDANAHPRRLRPLDHRRWPLRLVDSSRQLTQGLSFLNGPGSVLDNIGGHAHGSRSGGLFLSQ